MRFGSAKGIPAAVTPEMPAFYEWKVPGQAFSIQLSYDVVDRLGNDIMKGFWSVPKRGAEVGGLLLGRVVSSNSLTNGERTLFIEDYEPINCEHRRGPSYVLSESDRKRLERTMKKNGRGRQVIGFFRSHTRPGLYLDEDDMGVIRSYFSGPADIVLLVRPNASKTGMAGFFFWEEEDMRRHSTYREFPFSRAELAPAPPEAQAAEGPVAAAAAAGADAPAVPAAVSPPRDVKPAPKAATRPARAWAFPRLDWKKLSYAAALIVGTGLLEYQLLGLFGGSRSGSATRPAALRVERNGNYLQVSWDRNAPAILRARRGALSIADGRYRQELKLDPSHLRDGTVAYSPSTNDVSFRLEIEDGDRRVSESVRVVTATAADDQPAEGGAGPAVIEAASRRVPIVPRTDEAEGAATPAAPLARTRPGTLTRAQPGPAKVVALPEVADAAARSEKRKPRPRWYDDGL